MIFVGIIISYVYDCIEEACLLISGFMNHCRSGDRTSLSEVTEDVPADDNEVDLKYGYTQHRGRNCRKLTV
jgi:hypothetical protein